MDPTRLTPAEAAQIAANIKRGIDYTTRAAKQAHSLPELAGAMENVAVFTAQYLDLIVSYIRQQDRTNTELTHQLALLGQRVLALEERT